MNHTARRWIVGGIAIIVSVFVFLVPFAYIILTAVKDKRQAATRSFDVGDAPAAAPTFDDARASVDSACVVRSTGPEDSCSDLDPEAIGRHRFDAPTGVGATASRARIFTCTPASAEDELPCAREILTSLARRAYRRPVVDADLERLMPFYRDGRARGSRGA